jgi:hypothetical protein
LRSVRAKGSRRDPDFFLIFHKPSTRQQPERLEQILVLHMVQMAAEGTRFLYNQSWRRNAMIRITPALL